MSEFDLDDLKKIYHSRELIDKLVKNGIIKEKKFRKQLEYEIELDKLQMELLRLQEYIINNKKRLLIIYEGRDAAGKGGTISRTIAKMNPKNYHVTVLPKPSEIEQRQWFIQRYVKQLPMQQQVVFFDRSWYNRAVVEPVFGFCTPEEYASFMRQINPFENILIEDGMLIIKFYLTISKEEQIERLDDRRKDPQKQYKIGGLDEYAIEKWDDYSFYIEKMLRETGTEQSPWVEIISDNKRKTRLDTMKYILQHVEGFEPNIDIKISKKRIKIHQ
ncbi:MAG: polyphosphate kinase 2 [Weeksellaceae bacterium]